MPAILIVVWVSSCSTQKMVCPAYQSAFIFDTTELKKKFSLFINDTPRIYEVNKSKFLIIEPMSYRQKMASFRTIEMLPIYPKIPDSLKFAGDTEMMAERDVVDQQQLDSLAIHPGLVGPFNVEQENYMYLFRKLLVLPDRRESEQIDGEKAREEKKGFLNFLRNLFGGGAASDSTAVDEDGEPKEKKGLFNRLKGVTKEDLQNENADETSPEDNPEDNEEDN